jgi:hypothetical protein
MVTFKNSLSRAAFLAICSLACACFAPAASSAEPNSATSLLAAHVAFVGWKAGDGSIAGWRASGERTLHGSIDTFSEVQSGLAFRDTLATPQGIRDEVGFSGRSVWHADANGFSSALLGPPAQTAVDFDLVRAEATSEISNLSIEGQATVHGTQCTIVRVVPPGGTPMDLYEDPGSGAFLRVVVSPGSSGAKTIDNLGYLNIRPGKKVLSTWTVDAGTYTLSSTTPNAAIPTADVDQPVPQASWAYGAASAPLTFSTQTDNLREVRINAAVNGHSGVFLLSTETPSIVLYSNFAAQAGLTNLGTSDFSPYIGNIQFQGYARASTLQVGPSILHNVIVQEMLAPNAHIAGVLGYDLFARALVNVDLKAQTIQVLDPALYQPQLIAGAYAFPINLTDNTPRIAMKLPAGAIAYPMLDTGLSGFMMLSQAMRDSRKIDGTDISDVGVIGFGGQGATTDPIASTGLTVAYTAWNSATTSGSCITVPQLAIGPYAYTNPPLCFGGTNVFGNDRGLIGLDFLRHFNWTVDYPDANFVLTPNGN